MNHSNITIPLFPCVIFLNCQLFCFAIFGLIKELSRRCHRCRQCTFGELTGTFLSAIVQGGLFIYFGSQLKPPIFPYWLVFNEKKKRTILYEAPDMLANQEKQHALTQGSSLCVKAIFFPLPDLPYVNILLYSVSRRYRIPRWHSSLTVPKEYRP
jgi:hemolysin-activating ACP:hemolysin acyltransferase